MTVPEAAEVPGAGADEVIERVEAAIAAGDFADAARWLEAHLVELAGWHLERLREALDGLPPAMVNGNPRLAMVHRGVSNFFDQDKPLAAVDVAQQFAAIGPSGNETGDLVLAGIGEILALRSTRDFAAGIPIVERGRALVDTQRAQWLEVSGELRSIYLLQWGLTRMLAQDLDGAIRDFQESFWAGRRSAMPQYARNGAENAALLLALLDSLDPALEWLAKARTLPRAPEHLRTYVEECDPLVEAAVALARLETDAAREALASFRPAPETDLSWSVVAHLRARLGLLAGEPFGALDELARTNHPRGGAPDPGSFDEALLTIAEAELSLAVGRLPRAETVLERATPGPLLAASRARLALAKGDPSGALVLSLAGLHAPLPFARSDLETIAAVAQWRLERPAEAAEHLAHALEISRTQGVVAPFALLEADDVAGLAALVPGAAEVFERCARSGVDAPERARPVELSEREKAVLVELAGTASTQEIAARLFVSVNTVKTQLRSIYRKLGAHSRSEALEAAHRWGFDLGGTAP